MPSTIGVASTAPYKIKRTDKNLKDKILPQDVTATMIVGHLTNESKKTAFII